MQHYSGFGFVKAQFLAITKTGKRVVAQSNPKKKYDVIIVGGGGHGLATAYYLAKEVWCD